MSKLTFNQYVDQSVAIRSGILELFNEIVTQHVSPEPNSKATIEKMEALTELGMSATCVAGLFLALEEMLEALNTTLDEMLPEDNALKN